MVPVSTAQARWIVSEFRAQWPVRGTSGHQVGRHESLSDATDFLRTMIERIASDTSEAGVAAMVAKVADATDSYSELIRQMAAEQRQK